MLKCRAAGWLSGTLLVGVACSAQTSNGDPDRSTASDEPTACNTDGDCATGKHCKPLAPTDRELQVPAPMVAPCPYGACTSDATCGPYSVCEPFATNSSYPNCFGIVATCYAACSSDSNTGRICGEFNRCAADGHCVRQRCDDPDFAGCPSTMQCDPTYIWDADPNVPLGKYLTYGTASLSGGTLQESAAAQSGCVYRRCDDAAGHPCLSDWRCDLEHAEPTTSGCVAIPCAELGYCSNDEYYLCTPTSTEPHQNAPDVHGCTYKNCEERACSAGYTCDFASPKSDADGCRRTLCSEPTGEACDEFTKCAPDDPTAFAWGCAPRQCDSDGFDCSTFGMVCAPDGVNKNQYGCSSPPPPRTATATAVPIPSASQVVAIGSGTASAGVSAPPPTLTAPLPSASAGAFVGICQ